jgi:cupin 2 domain-containing protein
MITNLPAVGNVFEQVPNEDGVEKSYPLWALKSFDLEKIVSYGQPTQEDYWYDQARDEWVMLVKGTAVLLFDPGGLVTLNAGDFLIIPAHLKHRVEQCSSDAIWIALHSN